MPRFIPGGKLSILGKPVFVCSASQIWDLAEGKTNTMELAEAIDNSGTASFRKSSVHVHWISVGIDKFDVTIGLPEKKLLQNLGLNKKANFSAKQIHFKLFQHFI